MFRRLFPLSLLILNAGCGGSGGENTQVEPVLNVSEKAETPNTQKITAVFKECGMQTLPGGQFVDAWVLFTGKDGSDHLFGIADLLSATDPLTKFCGWGDFDAYGIKNPSQVGQLFTVEYETTNEVKKVLVVQEIK
jgi:hypothetical protein